MILSFGFLETDMTREQIRKHQDHLDKMDTLSERILNPVCVGSGAAFAIVLSQVLSVIGGK